MIKEFVKSDLELIKSNAVKLEDKENLNDFSKLETLKLIK
jgi:hypothetical protein